MGVYESRSCEFAFAVDNFSICGFIGGDFRNFIAGDENISRDDFAGGILEFDALNHEFISHFNTSFLFLSIIRAEKRFCNENLLENGFEVDFEVQNGKSEIPDFSKG